MQKEGKRCARSFRSSICPACHKLQTQNERCDPSTCAGWHPTLDSTASFNSELKQSTRRKREPLGLFSESQRCDEQHFSTVHRPLGRFDQMDGREEDRAAHAILLTVILQKDVLYGNQAQPCRHLPSRVTEKIKTYNRATPTVQSLRLRKSIRVVSKTASRSEALFSKHSSHAVYASHQF